MVNRKFSKSKEKEVSDKLNNNDSNKSISSKIKLRNKFIDSLNLKRLNLELNSLDLLLEEIEIMDESTFNSHIKKNKNDFANWVIEVVRDNELANALTNCKDKLDFENILAYRIRQIRKKMKIGKGITILKNDSIDISDIPKDFDLLDEKYASNNQVRMITWVLLIGLLIGLFFGMIMGIIFAKVLL